jgi:CRISPR-associated protein Csd1
VNTTDEAQSTLSPDGYDYVDVSLCILLKPNGEIGDIVDCRQEKVIETKKGGEKRTFVCKKVLLPKRSEKPGISNNFIEHRPLYIFGLNASDDGFTEEDDTNKAKKSHTCFAEYNLKMLEGLDSDIVNAYRNFIIGWKPENERNNPFLEKIKPYYNKGKFYFCFGLDGHPEILLNDDKAIKERWGRELNSTSDGNAENVAFCPIIGNVCETARIHNKINTIAGGNATGGVLIGVNKEAEESYCKTQAYNNNISVEAMKKYTTALNYLLANKFHHNLMEGMTLVYWAMSENDINETDFLNVLFGKETTEGKSDSINLYIDSLVKHSKRGVATDISNFHIDENAEFYLIGITPNSSRISIKFMLKDRFGNILSNVIQHQRDMDLESGSGNISLSRMLKELISPKASKTTVPSPITASIMNSILMGTAYPSELLDTVVRRVKMDFDEEGDNGKKKNVKLNSVRAGIIKACINRKARINNKEKEIKVALDKENLNEAYLCGRLFCILENLQYKSSASKLNRTIKDTYFASACAKPALVFPKLIKLSQFHSAKLDTGIRTSFDIQLQDIMGKLKQSFPMSLSIEEQGKFILGYYQERENHFKEVRKNKEIGSSIQLTTNEEE